MNSFLKKYLCLILAIVSFIIVIILEKGAINQKTEILLVKSFQKKFHEKETKLASYLEQIELEIQDSAFDGNYLKKFHTYNQLLQKEGYGFLIFKHNELVYWSDRSISFYDYFTEEDEQDKFWRLPNGYYLKEDIQTGDHIIVGLMLIKYDYPYKNKYLKNSFHKDFTLPPEFHIEELHTENSIPIHNLNNECVFSLKHDNVKLSTAYQLYFPGILYLIGLLFLFVFLRKEIKRNELGTFTKLAALAVVLFLIYWLHIILRVPNLFYDLKFFSPSYFSYNMWLPSLGDYLLISIFFFFWALNFNLDINFKRLSANWGVSIHKVIAAFLLLCALFFLLINKSIYVLVYNSSISFSLNRINDLTFHSILGYLSIAILLLGLFLVAARIMEEIGKFYSKRKMVFVIIATTAFMVVLQLLFTSAISYPIVLFLLAILLLLVVMTSKYLQKFTLSYLIAFIAIATLYSLSIINKTLLKKTNEAQQLLSTNLVAEHDPAAEVLLYKVQKQISVDSKIPELLIPPFEVLEYYIANTYFNGFFRKYDLQITICDGADKLSIEPDNKMVDCFPFFDRMIEDEGHQVLGTNFYFMDRMNGRITYFGKFNYPWASVSDSLGVTVFIELVSTLASEGLGYPELLLDKSMEKPTSYKNFSYAKYNNGMLVDSQGDFMYNHYFDAYEVSDETFTIGRWNGHRHIIYRINENNYVIVSREIFSLIDYLISFPYLFVFFFFLSLVFMTIGNKAVRLKAFSFDLRFKIQASIIAIVFVSLLVVAVVTIFYNVEEYHTKHQHDLNEKMKSISEEIDMRLYNMEEVNDSIQSWMLRELAKLSNIFRTDINIFGNDGNLLATSREEIYHRGLISTKINSQAYYELYENYKANYFQPEHIGELSYLSAYKPIINSKRNYLGTINLPYFTRQDKYSQEISTFIVAFLNLYVILFLASVIAAIFISNQITRPLILIRDNLRKMELGKRNEPLNYKGDDEIGMLTKEYNKKVDELSNSAELLARSERESAWREMAKQIAHEIKNPLTPMKLNIQYLQRSLGKSAQKDEFFDRVTKTLIEQIDNLSAISTEFSNFAQIPTARNQVFNLAGQIKKVIDLFGTHDRATISLQIDDAEHVEVNADREQLGRAIINLVKNAIQAIPMGVKGNVEIKLQKSNDMALITVTDDGSGIAEELRSKLFSPSFTTKSSGMGLGLSIVKSIVENFNGRIWFETELNVGTSFFVEIPIFVHK